MKFYRIEWVTEWQRRQIVTIRWHRNTFLVTGHDPVMVAHGGIDQQRTDGWTKKKIEKKDSGCVAVEPRTQYDEMPIWEGRGEDQEGERIDDWIEARVERRRTSNLGLEKRAPGRLGFFCFSHSTYCFIYKQWKMIKRWIRSGMTSIPQAFWFLSQRIWK